MEEVIYEIGELKFKQRRLPAGKSIKGLPALTRVLGPLVASANSDKVDTTSMVNAVADGIENLDSLVDSFKAVCDYHHTGTTDESTGEGRWLPLAHAYDMAFKGRPLDQLLWLVQCVSVEYGDFLTENGLRRFLTGLESFTSRLG